MLLSLPSRELVESLLVLLCQPLLDSRPPRFLLLRKFLIALSLSGSPVSLLQDFQGRDLLRLPGQPCHALLVLAPYLPEVLLLELLQLLPGLQLERAQ